MNDKKFINYGFILNPSTTYTINPKRDGAMLYVTLTLPKDVESEVEKQLQAMNDNYVDAQRVLDRIKNDKSN